MAMIKLTDNRGTYGKLSHHIPMSARLKHFTNIYVYSNANVAQEQEYSRVLFVLR